MRARHLSLAQHILQCGRPCCNLLDALACSKLATWCSSQGKSPWLAAWLQPPPLAASCIPGHCQPLALLLPLHHVPLSCMQLLSCQANCLLPSISSTLSLHPLSPLSHPWQVWQQVAAGISVSSKSYDHKKKGNLCTVPFLWWIKIPKSVFFGSHKASNAWLCLDTADLQVP
jgi:hypothetical protein